MPSRRPPAPILIPRNRGFFIPELMTYEDAKDQIKLDEGLRLELYRCSKDKLTIGYGWNIEDNGIPQEVADLLFEHSFKAATEDAAKFIGAMAWSQLNETRRGVLINMAFNLGLPTLRAFKRFRHYVQQGDYEKAANEMIDSAWYRQVGDRAKRLEQQMRNG